MNFEDILYSTVEAYREKYNLEAIQSANDEQIKKLIQEMEIHIERYKNTQHQLNEYQNNPEKYLDKPEGINYNHKVQLKAVNELILYLESVIKTALIEIKEREFARLTAPAHQITKYAQTLMDNRADIDKLKKENENVNKKEKNIDIIKHWTRTKSEFCQFIKSEYNSEDSKYLNLKDATKKLFSQYKFPYKWNPDKCYELVKKIS